MKKILSKTKYLLLSLIYLLPYFKVSLGKFIDGHDFELHLHRIYALESSITSGDLLPRWLANTAFGYGSPIFNFIWGVPYYFSIILKKIGLSYIYSWNLTIIFAGLLAGLCSYLWLKNKVSNFSAAVGSIIYVWTPYRLLNTFVRAGVGELYFLALLPLALYALERINNKKKIAIAAVIFFLLLYSHNGLILIGLPILLTYLFFTKKNKKFFKFQLQAIALGLLLSSFYWLPALRFQSLLNASVMAKKMLSFPPLLSLVRSKWEGGSVINGQTLIMSFQIGLAQLLIVFIAHIYTVYAIKRKKIKTEIIYWLVLFWISIFFMQPASRWLWINLPLIINLQLPFRLLFIPMIVASALSALLLDNLDNSKRKIVGAALVVLVLLANRNHLGVLKKDFNPLWFKSYQGSLDSGETLPKWINQETIKNNPNRYFDEFSIISGKGSIVNQEREDYKSQATILIEEPGEILIKRTYFPGWHIYINEKEARNFRTDNGIIISLNQGINEIKLKFKPPMIIAFANTISVATLIYLIAL